MAKRQQGQQQRQQGGRSRRRQGGSGPASDAEGEGEEGDWGEDAVEAGLEELEMQASALEVGGAWSC